MKTDYQTIQVEMRDNVAVFTMDNPPVNQLSTQFRARSRVAHKVAEDAHNLQLRESGNLKGKRRSVFSPDSYTVHASINFQVHPRPSSHALCFTRDLSGLLQTRRRDIQMIVKEMLHLVTYQTSQHENGRFNTGLTQ